MFDDGRLMIMLKYFCEMPRENGIVHAGNFHEHMRTHSHPHIDHLMYELVDVGALCYAELPDGDDGYRLRSRAKWEALAAKKAAKR